MLGKEITSRIVTVAMQRQPHEVSGATCGNQRKADMYRLSSLGRQPMTLVEYLHVDQARLDSYAEQLGSPTVYDKVPVWKAEIDIKGPKAGAEQARFSRSVTQHEKVERLRSYVAKHGYPDGPFLEMERTFSPFVLPAQAVGGVSVPALQGWLASTDDGSVEFLALVGSVRKSDDHVSLGSAYSTLACLAIETATAVESRKSVKLRDIPDELGEMSAAQLFERLNAKLQPPRRCWMIPRVRANGFHTAYGYSIVATASS